MTPPARRPRKSPTTNPELAVRRAERAIIAAEQTAPQRVVYDGPEEFVAALDRMAEEPAVEAPAVRVRADDPPAYVDAWNALYSLTHGTHEEVVQRQTAQGV